MAHFAKIEKNENDKWIVQEVHVINNDVVGEPELSFPETEPLGQAFQALLGLSGIWKQTSYNNNFRKRYAGIGHEYDEINDVFISPSPYPSWILDQNFDWQAPISKPNINIDESKEIFIWDEENQEWKIVKKITNI